MDQTNAQRTALIRGVIMNMAPKIKREVAEERTWQSINSIWEKVKAELVPQGLRISREHVQAQLKKLESEGKAKGRLVDKPQNEGQRGRKNHLVFLLLPQRSGACEHQVAEPREEARPKKIAPGD